MNRLRFGIATLILCALALLTTSAVSRDTCVGSFDAQMKIGAADKQMTRKFDGKLAWSNPNLRLDLKDKVTKESMVVLVDFKGGDATLLYPDTLNGMKTKLPAMDTSGYIAQFQHLLAGNDAKMQQGWKKEKLGSEKVGNTAATKYKLTGPKGESVLWWVDAKERPLRVSTGRGGNQVTLNFSEINFDAEVPASTFSYDKSYSVLELSNANFIGPVKP